MPWDAWPSRPWSLHTPRGRACAGYARAAGTPPRDLASSGEGSRREGGICPDLLLLAVKEEEEEVSAMEGELGKGRIRGGRWQAHPLEKRMGVGGREREEGRAALAG